MTDKLKELEIKKLIQEYNFLISDDSFKQELIGTNKQNFLEIISKKRVEINPDYKNESENTPQEKKKEDVLNTVDEDVKNKVKKIYREIVKKTHPDITNSEDMIELYMRATEAQDNYNLFELYLISSTLNIPIVLDENDFNVLNELINNKKRNLKSIEASFIWLWIHSKTDEEKDSIVKLFIEKNP
jgi:hypothetical protein